MSDASEEVTQSDIVALGEAIAACLEEDGLLQVNEMTSSVTETFDSDDSGRKLGKRRTSSYDYSGYTARRSDPDDCDGGDCRKLAASKQEEAKANQVWRELTSVDLASLNECLASDFCSGEITHPSCVMSITDMSFD